jgi:hypothetical protein
MVRDTDKVSKSTKRKSGSGFRTKIFSVLGGTSVVTDSNLRDLLENGKIYENMATDH